MKPNVKDAALIDTLTLPNGAATTTSTGMQLHTGATNTEFVAPCEAVLAIPAVTAGQLPDTQTISYTLETSDTSDFASATTVTGTVVQTGAGGVGAAAAELRHRPGTGAKKFIRAKAVKAGAANASAVSTTLALAF